MALVDPGPGMWHQVAPMPVLPSPGELGRPAGVSPGGPFYGWASLGRPRNGCRP